MKNVLLALVAACATCLCTFGHAHAQDVISLPTAGEFTFIATFPERAESVCFFFVEGRREIGCTDQKEPFSQIPDAAYLRNVTVAVEDHLKEVRAVAFITVNGERFDSDDSFNKSTVVFTPDAPNMLDLRNAGAAVIFNGWVYEGWAEAQDSLYEDLG